MRATDKCGVHGCNKPRVGGPQNYSCEKHERERWRITVSTVLRILAENITRIYIHDCWWDVVPGTLRFERENLGEPFRAVALFRSVADGGENAVLVSEIIAVNGRP